MDLRRRGEVVEEVDWAAWTRRGSFFMEVGEEAQRRRHRHREEGADQAARARTKATRI